MKRPERFPKCAWWIAIRHDWTRTPVNRRSPFTWRLECGAAAHVAGVRSARMLGQIVAPIPQSDDAGGDRRRDLDPPTSHGSDCARGAQYDAGARSSRSRKQTAVAA